LNERKPTIASGQNAFRLAALSGLGIFYVLRFQVEAANRSKRLKSLLTHECLPSLVIQAVFTHRRNLSSRVQVLLEFLAAQSAKTLGK
jgi:DNA-binding transcriptional LysR family regulator